MSSSQHLYREKIYIVKDIILKLVQYGKLSATSLISFCGLNFKKHTPVLDKMELKGLITTTATNPFPQFPTPPSSNPSLIKMTSENKNTYTISSGSTRINNFVTTYTITGGINYIKSSSDLIVSTIIKDFDSNANIGYVKNDLSSNKYCTAAETKTTAS